MSRRCLVIGLDGADFRVIDPMISRGKLPALSRLAAEGARATLESPPPAATFPTWATFMTGVNPGVHGIFDFTRMVDGEYAVQFVNSTFMRSPSIWRILSDRGRRVVSLGVPGTYPPEPVNGVLVAGFDSPVTTQLDGRFVHPRPLHREISRRFGPYPVADIQELRIGPGWHERAAAVLLDTIRRKCEIAKFLMERGDWDFFMLLFGESDTAAHHFWMFHDAGSPRRESFYDAGSPRHGSGDDGDRFDSVLEDVYEALDRAVGELVAAAGPDCGVLVLSDHGFGGSGRTVFHLNRWLASEGLLEFRGGPSGGSGKSPVHAVADLSKDIALRWMPSRLQEFFFRAGGGVVASRIESASRFGGIDWQRTAAYSEELNYAPSIRINLAGREPSGTVSSENYEQIRDRIAEAVEGLRNPITGAPVVSKAHRREELYSGPETVSAPDLLLEMAFEQHGDGEYSYNCLPSGGTGGEYFRLLESGELMGAKGAGMNGSHRKEGIFLLRGPDVSGGVDAGTVRMTDAAPVILHLLGEPVPSYMEGDLPRGMFPPGTELERSESGTAPGTLRERISLKGKDQEVVRRRLAGMGYLEDDAD